MKRARMVVWSALAAATLGGAVSGCSYGGSFDDPDPGSRLHAIRSAVEANDRSAIPHLIRLLDSDDAAVRLYSIQALEHFTGQTLGYDHAGPAHDRRLAVERWVQWYQSQSPEQQANG